MSPAQVGFLVAGVAAALYGLLLLPRPPDWRRTLVKAAFAGALAVAARFSDAPPLLSLALGLSAVGDAALAIDPRRTLAGGLVAFLLAHVAYLALFWEIGGGVDGLAASPLRLAAAVAALAAAGGLIAWLWPTLGGMRGPVAVYALAIAAMTLAALTLPGLFGLVMLGAGLFMASDALLAARLFRYEGNPHRVADGLVWWLYVAAQGAIAWGFLVPWRL